MEHGILEHGILEHGILEHGILEHGILEHGILMQSLCSQKWNDALFATTAYQWRMCWIFCQFNQNNSGWFDFSIYHILIANL